MTPSATPAPRGPLAHALAALAHPLCLAAVALLLLNDHLLKPLWPGWLTGKLSDVAGLAFAPLLVALPLALLPTARRGDRWLLWPAIAATGLWFAAAKTLPEVHAASLALLSTLTNGPFTFQRDPTDLLALPALLAAAHCWRTTAVVHPATGPRPNGWLVAGVALLACVATSYAPPRFGASCFRGPGVGVADHRIAESLQVAVDGETTGWFSTRDGGLTWFLVERTQRPYSFSRIPSCSPSAELGDPENGQLRYRVVVDDRIDVSEDGGAPGGKT